MLCTPTPAADLADVGEGPTLAELLAAPRRPRVRWAPGRMYDVPEDEDGACFFCHDRPGPAGCDHCGATGR